MKPVVLAALVTLAVGSLPTYCLACYGHHRHHHHHHYCHHTAQAPANGDQTNNAAANPAAANPTVANPAVANQVGNGGDTPGGPADNNLWIYKGTVTAGPVLHVTVSHLDSTTNTTQSKTFIEDSSTVILVASGSTGGANTETTFVPGTTADLQEGKTVLVYHQAGSDVPVTIKVLPGNAN